MVGQQTGPRKQLPLDWYKNHRWQSYHSLGAPSPTAEWPCRLREIGKAAACCGSQTPGRKRGKTHRVGKAAGGSVWSEITKQNNKRSVSQRANRAIQYTCRSMNKNPVCGGVGVRARVYACIKAITKHHEDYNMCLCVYIKDALSIIRDSFKKSLWAYRLNVVGLWCFAPLRMLYFSYGRGNHGLLLFQHLYKERSEWPNLWLWGGVGYLANPVEKHWMSRSVSLCAFAYELRKS